tara:strand:+ start:414 stop:599 length:186 start_codon:yes stop_codon:yes gene_type:complete
MNKKETIKLINTVIKQSSKKELEIFLKQIQEMLIIPIQNVLHLNNKELKEIEKNILLILKN